MGNDLSEAQSKDGAKSVRHAHSRVDRVGANDFRATVRTNVGGQWRLYRGVGATPLDALLDAHEKIEGAIGE